jgi:phosphatidylinositol alpha-1,6-mannosyltransferase
MRVLVLATKYFGVGGAEAYTRMFTEAIAEEGARVEILSLLDGEAGTRSCPGRYLGDRGRRSTRLAQAGFVLEALRRGTHYDLIICSHVAVAPVALALLCLRRIPYVVLGYGIDVWGPVGVWRRMALRRAARMVALSHFTARMSHAVHGVPKDRISVVHPAVDPVLLSQARARPDVPRDGSAVMLLTVARLSSQEGYKGCDAVISALPEVIADGGPVHYTIVGDGDDRPRLRVLAQDRGVSGAVTFAGTVQRDALAEWYQACDIFVMPSVAERRPNGWAGEGFGIAYIEAAAFGRPVIAGSGGGAPEAVRNGITGFVVDGKDSSAVARTLTQLVRDGTLRTRMGDAGRRWVLDYFTFDRFRRDVREVLTAAIGTSSL